MSSGTEPEITLTELSINVVLNIKGELVVNQCKTPEEAAKNIATHAFMTMGKHTTMWDGEVTDGCINIQHTFKQAKVSYEDELTMFTKPITHEMQLAALNYPDPTKWKLSDHVILWLYRVRIEKPRQEGRLIDTLSHDNTRQTYFIGSVALNTAEFLKCSIESAKNRVFQVKHNFIATHVTCTVCLEENADKKKIVQNNIDFLAKMTTEYTEMETKLREFDVKNHLRDDLKVDNGPAADQQGTANYGLDFVDDIDESRILSKLDIEQYAAREVLVTKLKDFRFRPSPLRHLAEINELVQLEQV
jgi:hypothetical protein